MIKSELWKNVIGYEGIYQVSNMGKIKSLARTFYSGKKYTNRKDAPEQIISTTTGKDGYIRVTFKAKPLLPKTFLVHRLVAEAFIDNPKEALLVNHINGIKSDNNTDNLEWVSPSENNLHSWKIGLNTGNKGRFGSRHPRSKRVEQYKEGLLVAEFGSLREVQRETRFYHSNISEAIKNNKPYNGYHWRYKE
jgi:hypothetical protein